MTAETYEPPLTPVQVEQRLSQLLKANWDTYLMLREAESKYETAKGAFEIAYARARLTTFTDPDQKGWSVARRDDHATVLTEPQRLQLAAATSLVKAARAKAAAVRVQADLIRSIGLSVRTSMTMEG